MNRRLQCTPGTSAEDQCEAREELGSRGLLGSLVVKVTGKGELRGGFGRSSLLG
jgi:hypothetical protein